MSVPTIPAFDPDSPDVLILEAFEKVRAHRAYTYKVMEGPVTPEQDAELDRGDQQRYEDEGRVEGDFATTIPGILTKLQLSLTVMTDRWIDMGLMTHGFYALYQERRNLNGQDSVVVDAMHELLHLDWGLSLLAYETAAVDLTVALALDDAVSAALDQQAGGRSSARVDAARLAVDGLTDRASRVSAAALQRLVRTLAPTPEDHLRKVDILLQERWNHDVVPWLARDTRFLTGRISPDADTTDTEGAR